MTSERKLAAIMFTDIADYTAMMQDDEEKAITIIKRYNSVMSEMVGRYHGEILNDYGDGNLCVFPSVINAVQCALDIQLELQIAPQVPLRIGLHIGEYFIEEGKALGDGVNVASRIQSLGQPNTVLFSEDILHIIKNHQEFNWISLGKIEFKNVENPIDIYALTNKGLVVPGHVKTDQGRSHFFRSFKKVLVPVIGIFILLALFILYRYSGITGSDIHKEKSIAVLAFADMSPGQDQEYLGDGIAEAIINSLAQVKGLKVIGRTSSFSYKGKNLDLTRIGKQLHVKTLLEGSVQKSGERLRITAQLIKASDGSHIWSKRYDQNLSEIFTIQDDIAQKISDLIQINLSPGERNKLASEASVNPEAYEYFLKGQFYWNKLTRNDLASAEHYFNLAVQTDPEFAAAYTGIATVWVGRMQQGITTYYEGIDRAKVNAKKAFDLDSMSPEVHRALGGIGWADWDWKALLGEYKRSVTINPNNPITCCYYAHYLYFFGHWEEGKIWMQRAITLDPINPLVRAISGMSLMYTRQYDEIISRLEKNLKKAPDDDVTLTTLRSAYHMKGRFEDAYKTWIKYYEIRGDSAILDALKAGYQEGGYRKALQKVAELFVEKSKTGKVRSWLVGTLYTRAGMKDQALTWLEIAYEEHDLNMPYIKADPIFDYMRDDPRFKDLIARLHF